MPRSTDERSTFWHAAHALHCEFCLSKSEVIFCKRSMEEGHWGEKQEVQQTAFVWVSTSRPVIYTLIGDAIATRGIVALRDSGREGERGKELHHGKGSSCLLQWSGTKLRAPRRPV